MPSEREWHEYRVYGEGYVEPQTYAEVKLTTNQPIIEVPTQFVFYLRQVRDIQVAILFIIPQASESQLLDRIDLSLETLVVNPELPRGLSGVGASGTPGGGPDRPRIRRDQF